MSDSGKTVAAATLESRGVVTVRALATLRAHGRI
jgi:hypothetical protein